MADPLVDVATVSVSEDLGSTLEDVVRALAGRLRDAGRVSDLDGFVADVLAREAQGSTALPGGVALPHARSAGAATPSVAIAALPTPLAEGGHQVDLVFLLAVPGDQPDRYLALLRQVSNAVVKPAFRDACREATSAASLARIATEGFGAR